MIEQKQKTPERNARIFTLHSCASRANYKAMKHIFFTVFCLLLFTGAQAQDSLKFDYAVLLKPENDYGGYKNKWMIYYSNGNFDTLSPAYSSDDVRDWDFYYKNLFRYFQHLNEQGFELVSITPYIPYATAPITYYFKRPKRK